MSLSFARASEQTVLSFTIEAMALMASKSPFELAAKPASITSTFIRSRCFAIRIFSSFVIDAPGDCSPSRNVVSKMISLSVMGCSKALCTGGQTKRDRATVGDAQQQTKLDGGRERSARQAR